MKWIVPATLALLIAAPALAQDISRSSSSSSQVTDSPDISRSSSAPSSSSVMDSPDISRSSSAAPSSSMDSPDISRSSSAVDSSAESSEPVEIAMPSREALEAFFDICTDVAGGDPEAYDRAAGAGWQSGDYEEAGPYKAIYSAVRGFEGYGDVLLWSSVESYTSQRLGYCRVDLADPTLSINFADFPSIAGLSGGTTEQDGYIFGAWETPDGQTMVIGDRRDGVVQIEFNIRIPQTPAQ